MHESTLMCQAVVSIWLKATSMVCTALKEWVLQFAFEAFYMLTIVMCSTVSTRWPKPCFPILWFQNKTRFPIYSFSELDVKGGVF